MLKFIIRCLRGYLYVVLIGNSPERFINLCRSNNIYTWNHKVESGKYYMYMLSSDFKSIYGIYKKTKVYPHIVKKCGIPFFISRIIRRKTLVFGFMLYIAIIYLCSASLWDIQIKGQSRYTKEEMLEFVESLGVKKYARLDSIDCDGTEKAIRIRYNDISWVSASLTGCNMEIHIIEGDVIDSDAASKGDFSHIVASSDGVIDYIITRSGTPAVGKGDRVKKGDILVAGIVDIHDDSSEVVKKNPVYADADIYLNTTYKYYNVFDMLYPKKLYPGKEKQYLTINILNRFFLLQNPLNRFKKMEKYDIMTNNYGHGITWSVSKLSEYETVYETYTKNEALLLAKKNLDIYIDKLGKKDIIVGKKDITFEIKDGLCIASGTIKVKEPQLKRKSVSEKDWSVDSADEQGRKDN